MAEPSIQPTPAGIEERINDSLERLATKATTLVAGLLMVFAAIAIVGVVGVAWKPLVHDRDFMHAALLGLGAALVAMIAMILLELVHTTPSRGPISSQSRISS